MRRTWAIDGLQAFGTVTADGRVVIGTSNDAVASTTSSTLAPADCSRATGIVGALTTAGTLIGSVGVG